MLNMRQNCIRPRLCPGPRCGSLRSSQDPLVGWEWGRPLLISLDTFGFSIWATSALFFLPPPIQIPGTWLRHYTLRTPCQKSLATPLNTLVSINAVALHWARLLLGLVTVCW